MKIKSNAAWIIIGAFIIVVCCGFVYIALRGPTPVVPDPSINSSNCDAIQPGMSERQVETILSRPFDQWGQGVAGMKQWLGQNGECITVYFNRDGTVYGTVYDAP